MSSSNVSYHKGKARRAAAWDAAESKQGVGLGGISASAKTHERRTHDLERFRAEFPTLHAQQTAIARASEQARSALGTTNFSAGEFLAWRNLVAACGADNAIAFVKRYRDANKPRKGMEVVMREMKGAKFLTRLSAAATVTVEEALSRGLLKHSIFTMPTAAPAAAAAAVVFEELEVAVAPWPMTPWLKCAISWNYTSEEARLARDPTCEVQRVVVVAAAWRLLFSNLRKWFKARCIDRRGRAAICCVNTWDDYKREDQYFADRFFHKLPRYQYDSPDDESWSRLTTVKEEVDQAQDRFIGWELRVLGVSAILLGLLKKVRAKASQQKKVSQGSKRKRMTFAEREAHHQATIKKLAMPGYLVPKALDTFAKPIEQISSVRLGNLRLAVGQAQLRTLNKDVRDFVAFHGGRVAEGPGGVFIPFRGQSQGYCFVKLVSHENARALLERLADEPTMLDRETNVERPVLAELAASERKSKAEMEAEKAKAAEARRLAALAKPLTEREKIVEAMNAKMAAPTTELKQVLKPVCLGASRKAAEEAAKAAEAAALKAKVQAMFSCTLPSAVAATSAPTFELSFSGAAAKPKPVLTKLVDATHISVGGVVKQFVASPLTELGKAQEALRELTAREEKEAARQAQKVRRAARAKRNAVAKAKCVAEGREFDVTWEGEVDSEDESAPVIVLSAHCVAAPPRLPVRVADADACAAARELMLASFKPTVKEVAKEEAVIVLPCAETSGGYDSSRY